MKKSPNSVNYDDTLHSKTVWTIFPHSFHSVELFTLSLLPEDSLAFSFYNHLTNLMTINLVSCRVIRHVFFRIQNLFQPFAVSLPTYSSAPDSHLHGVKATGSYSYTPGIHVNINCHIKLNSEKGSEIHTNMWHTEFLPIWMFVILFTSVWLFQ